MKLGSVFGSVGEGEHGMESVGAGNRLKRLWEEDKTG